MAYCPESNFHQMNKTYRLQSVGKNIYKCPCGCEFRWENEYTWEIIKHSPVMQSQIIERLEKIKDKSAYTRDGIINMIVTFVLTVIIAMIVGDAFGWKLGVAAGLALFILSPQKEFYSV